MNSKSSIAGALIASMGLMFYICSNPQVAVSSPTPVQIQDSTSGFAYAQLTVEGDEFIFDEGGLALPRARSMTALMRFLGSSQRPTYVNLLNAIGAQGWEIVESDTDASVVTFKRRL